MQGGRALLDARQRLGFGDVLVDEALLLHLGDLFVQVGDKVLVALLHADALPLAVAFDADVLDRQVIVRRGECKSRGVVDVHNIELAALELHDEILRLDEADDVLFTRKLVGDGHLNGTFCTPTL